MVTVTDFEERLVAAMPGDDISRHPGYEGFADNPYRGRNPQEVLRLLRDGTIPDQKGRKQAQDWLKTCERCGEKIFGMRGGCEK